MQEKSKPDELVESSFKVGNEPKVIETSYLNGSEQKSMVEKMLNHKQGIKDKKFILESTTML